MINNILSLLIWVPIFSGLAILFYNKKDELFKCIQYFYKFFYSYSFYPFVN